MRPTGLHTCLQLFLDLLFWVARIAKRGETSDVEEKHWPKDYETRPDGQLVDLLDAPDEAVAYAAQSRQAE